MKRVFSRKTKKKTQVKLTPREAQNIIRQEFIDSHGNKINIQLDFTPHLPNEPTIKLERQYDKE